nr:metallophosphoesterase [Bacillus alkalisoli]
MELVDVIIFGIVFLLIYVALVFYIGWSGWGWMKSWVKDEISWKVKLLYIVTLTFVSTSFILGRFFQNTLLHIVGSLWMAFFYLLLVLLPLVHISVWLLTFTRLSRRHLDRWSSIVTIGLTFSLVGLGLYNAYSPIVQTYEVHIEKNTPTTERLQIVMASDMHFGVLSNRRHAARMVKEINALNPDLVVFPGDIVDDDIDPFVIQGIHEVLAQINAPLGVYISLGNHDKHSGPIEDLIVALERGNVKVLYDEAVMVMEDIILIGRRDRTNRGRQDIASLTKDIPLDKTAILLEHQPYDLDVAQENGIDLILSGHTHLGQIFPGSLITRRIYENDWGYMKKDSLHSIVSMGYGFWGPPIRLGTRSEIVQIIVTIGG